MKCKRMRMGSLVAMLAVTAMLAACERGPQAIDAQAPTVSLSATNSSIVAGETTTIMAQTGNLLGRQVDIEWSTTLGEVEPTAEGRMARFTSSEPGTAVVTIEMNADGQIVRDQINITVDSVE